MTLTARLVNFLDKTRIENLFLERNDKVTFALFSFNPNILEKTINRVFKTKGNFYHPNELEKEIIRELEYRNTVVH